MKRQMFLTTDYWLGGEIWGRQSTQREGWYWKNGGEPQLNNHVPNSWLLLHVSEASLVQAWWFLEVSSPLLFKICYKQINFIINNYSTRVRWISNDI